MFGPEGLRTTRLMLYILLAVVLMAMDQRGHYIPRIRAGLSWLAEPVYYLVDLPARALRGVHTYSRSFDSLLDEKQRQTEELLARLAQLQRLDSLEEENRRLRALLHATRGREYRFRFAEMLQVNLDPYSHQVLIDRGTDDGVFAGQAVIDGAGVMGQVESVHLNHSRVRLISDPDHAIPVQILRTGLRTVAYGTGDPRRLLLPNLPMQSDVRPGDVLVTSGLGDRFPTGFPVAEVEQVERDAGAAFASVRARPLAALDRGREVLLVLPVPEPEPEAAGPTRESAPPPTGEDGGETGEDPAP